MTTAVSEIWRYPVKSFAGEKLVSTELTERGIPYDRFWAVRDVESGELLGGRSVAELMMFSARFCEDPIETRQIAEITFPDGTTRRTDDHQIDESLSRALNRKVVLSEVKDVSDEDYYARPQSFTFATDIIRRSFGLEADEPLTDLSGKTKESAAYIENWQTYRTRPGTHFDTSTLHILTAASIRHIQALLPEVEISVRRFRPNILVSDHESASAPIEFEWVQKHLSIGTCLIDVTWETVRCIMTTREQAELPKAAKVMRTLVRNTQQKLGVCAEVIKTGRIAIGDSVDVLVP